MSKTINNLNKSLVENITPNEIGAATSSELNTVKNNIGTVSNLKTNNKTIVEAINELFQNVDNGKQLIADAIDDEAITKDSTFEAMSEAIAKSKASGKRSLYNELIAKGYGATESMSVEEMISLLEDCNIDPNEIKQISTNNSHTFILKNDGTVWATGYNFYGQLGLGHSTDKARFAQVDIDNVKQIECGEAHTMIIKNDGSLWGCGYGDYGQLGLNSYSAMKSFTQVTINMNNDAKQVACGDTHTLLLKTDGTVWTCGANSSGQLGLGSSDSQIMEFSQVSNISDAKQVECYENSSFILKNDGSLWACGNNSYGQLGLGDSGSSTKRTSFTQVTTNINNDVKQVVCGAYHTVILKNEGTVWACGSNTYGQLGLGDANHRSTFTKVTTNISDVKQIACGGYHSVMLKNDGTLWSVGNNTYGQLGLGDSGSSTKRTSFTQVTTNISNIKQIACGVYSSFVCNNEGLYACGDNSKGQLNGDKSTTFKNNLPIGSTEEYTLKLKLWQFLFNMELPVTSSMSIEEMLEVLVNKGDHLEDALDNVKDTLVSLMQEGGYDITDNEDIDSLLELLALSGLNISEIRQIACSQSHTVILKNDRSVWTCGYNNNGQLGLGTSDTNAHNVFTQATTNINNDVKQIACGYYHTVILKTDGSVWGCGNAQYGQLGLGNFNNQTSFTQVTTNINNDVKQIACGYNHTFILKTDGSLWACGNNEYGQLGLGDTNEYCTSFTQVTTNINNDVKQIACGQYHTFILKNDGSIWACGNAKYGQLGLGNYNNQTTFTQVTTNINNDVKRIACGYNHTFISKNDGSIWSCGLNSKGQLGLNDTTSSRTTFTQVTTNINNDVKQLVCGDAFTFILKNDGSLWTCGYNYRGQLGLGTSDTNAHSVFTQVTTNINNDVKRIACGYYHTVISKNDGSVWACGYNNRGQLGLNDTTNRSTFTQVPRGL